MRYGKILSSAVLYPYIYRHPLVHFPLTNDLQSPSNVDYGHAHNDVHLIIAIRSVIWGDITRPMHQWGKCIRGCGLYYKHAQVQ